MLGVNERMGLKLFGREIMAQTDAQTGRRTDDLLSHNRALH